MKWFKKKEKEEGYKLTFDKSVAYTDKQVGNQILCKAVPDATLLGYLIKLQEKYSFEIININFDGFYNNEIIIKCNEENKIKIFSEYCMGLTGCIKNCKF